MKIISISEPEASQTLCPFNLSTEMYCHTNDCLAWTVIFEEKNYKDFNGGKERAKREAKEFNISPVRTGPEGSEGEWVVPELGYCKRLWP